MEENIEELDKNIKDIKEKDKKKIRRKSGNREEGKNKT